MGATSSASFPSTRAGPTFAARLVELDPDLAQRARERAAEISPTIEVVTGDASSTSSFAGAVPAGIVLACGIFGNITDDDIHNTVAHLPSLCAPNATVIWTRGTFAPDLTPTVRVWFMEAGFTELDFVAIADTTAGGRRRPHSPRRLTRSNPTFTFSRFSGGRSVPRNATGRPGCRADALPAPCRRP